MISWGRLNLIQTQMISWGQLNLIQTQYSLMIISGQLNLIQTQYSLMISWRQLNLIQTQYSLMIISGQQDSGACLACTPGYFCGYDGLDAPTGLCDPGWYCESGSYLAQPTSPEGGKCLAGTYCPMGSYTPTGCDPGSYCGTDMLSTVTGNCNPGYYCTGNSTTAQPTGTGGLNLITILSLTKMIRM